MSCYQWQGDDLVLFIKTQPQASRDELVELIANENSADQLKIRITASPVDGKANKHLLKYLSKIFKVPPSHIKLLSGQTGRNKKLLIKKPAAIPEILQT